MKSDAKRKELLVYYKRSRDKLVKRFAYRAGSPANAEDVVQEAFTRAIQYIDAFDPNNKEMSAWMNTILNNSLKDFKKAERNQGMATQEDKVVEDFDLFVHEKELLQKLAEDIQGLNNRNNQDILRMFVFLGYSAKEVARLVDVNIHTVRKTIAEFYKYARESYG